jgi:hypothetical protein
MSRDHVAPSRGGGHLGRDNLDPEGPHPRGWVIQRVFTHDVWHTAEMNESLGRAGLPQIDLWD